MPPVKDEQKKPGWHWLAVAEALPAAKQLPAAHAVHDAALVKLVPPTDHVPTGHGYCS